MAEAALIVSIISAIASAAAVGVAVWTHRQQGSRIQCRSAHAFPMYPSGPGEHCISVEAVNKGRSAATIMGWGYVVLDERGRVTENRIVPTVTPPWQPTLPYRLEAQSSASWMLPLHEIVDTLARHGGGRGVRAFVQTGTGERVVARKEVRLD
jgi:hypothetical protein